jgi:hypothetical protein
MDRILVIGDNVPLLLTRALLLNRTGAATAYCATSELPAYYAGTDVALVVLCHTVKGERRRKVLTQVSKRWPEARILQVLGGNSDQSMLSGVDGWVPSMEPGMLIACAQELLGNVTG